MAFDNDQFAANLRSQRARADITQGRLAEAIGVNVATIVKYEDGTTTPGADKVFALADVLRCTPNELLGWKKRAERAAAK